MKFARAVVLIEKLEGEKRFVYYPAYEEDGSMGLDPENTNISAINLQKMHENTVDFRLFLLNVSFEDFYLQWDCQKSWTLFVQVLHLSFYRKRSPVIRISIL